MIKIPTSATMNVTVRIHQRYLLACSAFSDQESVKDIGWYRCTTNDCEHEWDKHRIAHVQNMRETISDNPNFEVYTNGTLVIKRVLPVDDGKIFHCSAETNTKTHISSTTRLSITKGDNCYIIILIIIMIICFDLRTASTSLEARLGLRLKGIFRR